MLGLGHPVKLWWCNLFANNEIMLYRLVHNLYHTTKTLPFNKRMISVIYDAVGGLPLATPKFNKKHLVFTRCFCFIC